jgi:outer membrane murein-binding lipoprotein Lpp
MNKKIITILFIALIGLVLFGCTQTPKSNLGETETGDINAAVDSTWINDNGLSGSDTIPAGTDLVTSQTNNTTIDENQDISVNEVI